MFIWDLFPTLFTAARDAALIPLRDASSPSYDDAERDVTDELVIDPDGELVVTGFRKQSSILEV